jgi:AraC-like DNA-binding protein
MQPAASPEEMLAAPLGKYYAGSSFVVWVQSPTLAGSVYFGRPSEEDFPALMALGPLPLSPALTPPFDAVIDCTRLDGLSVAAFEALVRHLAEVGGVTQRVHRAAVVRPGNMTGATLGGLFYEWVATRFAAALFTDPVEAYRWLGRPDGDGERLAVEAALTEALGVPSFLRGLREWLGVHLDEPSVTTAARALGLSPRSLQRHLQGAGTHFRGEVDRARVRAAEALLIDGGDKLEIIARQVGCGSLSHFSTLFRRATGETPSDFRSRRR